jgi:hypothetical protein
LVLALMALAVISGLAAVALQAVATRARLIGDSHWVVESDLRANGVLARARVAHASELSSLMDGDSLAWPAIHDADGWSWRGMAARHAAVIVLMVTASRTAADGTVEATRTRSLLLFRVSADTVRVLTHRPRF